jgi:DNA topoisomerase-1
LKQIEKLRKAISDADDVILASDDDREGEAIAWHICQLFGLPIETTKRIIFHEITESAILSAIIHPRTINMELVYAQQTRQILDLLVGFNISPILWNNIAKQHSQSLSAGRCQTPALRIIYDNYLDIVKSPGQLAYNITGYFTNQNLLFELNKQLTNKDDVRQFLTYCSNPDMKYICNVSDPKKVIKKSPEPLTTSTLQQLASNELHLSPKDTMKYAQQLYENGYITYMRTDIKKYSSEFIDKTSAYITTNYGQSFVSQALDNLRLDLVKNNNLEEEKEEKEKKEKPSKSKKVISAAPQPKPQGAHEAIRPVSILEKDIPNTNTEIQAKAVKLYNLIWKHTLESCMSSAQYTSITATITLQLDAIAINTKYKDEYKSHHFAYKAEQVVFQGWQIVENKQTTDEKAYNYLARLAKGVAMIPKKIEARSLLKDLKSHYTEAKLIQLLEENGIGRPSTFASIVDKIMERKYVEKQNIEGKEHECVDFLLDSTNNISEIVSKKVFGNEKNKIVIQPLGIIVVEFLIKHFSTFFDYAYTKEMEDLLDKIANGMTNWNSVCQLCHDDLIRIIDGLKDLKKFEIKIDEEHSIIIGKFGPVIKYTTDQKVTDQKVTDQKYTDQKSSDTKKGKNQNQKGTSTFIPIKKGLDIKELQNFEQLNGRQLTINDVIDNTTNQPQSIGKYKGLDLHIKTGKYGIYAQWGANMKSLKDMDKPIENLEYLEVLTFLEKDNLLDSSKPVGFVRDISSNLSIRTGKFGDYIFYKKPRAKKPDFFKLNGFKDDYKTCDKGLLLNWIKLTYKIDE